LYEEASGRFLLGSPLRALSIRRPFSRYIFSDLDQDCVHSLKQRVAPYPNAQVFQGDANSPDLHAQIVATIPRGALVVVYLDPAEINLHFSTVRFFARRFKFVDLIINLPTDGIVRALMAGHADKVSAVLEHVDPFQMVPHRGNADSQYYAAVDAVRDHYDAKLAELGFKTPVLRDTICQIGSERMLCTTFCSRPEATSHSDSTIARVKNYKGHSSSILSTPLPSRRTSAAAVGACGPCNTGHVHRAQLT
jgi:three-Cys-motif partner protein